MKILFTSPIRPFGVVNKYSTKETNYEALYSNFARGQGIWSPRGLMNEPANHFIAHNLKAYSTVLDHPTQEELLAELKKGYDLVAISFITCYFPRVKIMVQKIKQQFPKQKIVLGGYGINTPGVEKLPVDYFCRGEGLEFFNSTFNIPLKQPLENPAVPCHDSLKLFGLIPLNSFLNTFYFVTGLGCSFGCEFCATSHFWGRTYVPLLENAQQIYNDLKRIASSQKHPPIFVCNQDDFLSKALRNRQLLELIRTNQDTFFLFCFSSAFAISQYTPEELVELGIDTVLVGVETEYLADGRDQVYNRAKKQDVKTKKEIDLKNMIEQLAEHGISAIGAFILNVPQHNRTNLPAEVAKHYQLPVMASQVSTMTPFPGTPFFNKLDQEKKLLYDYHQPNFDENNWKYYDGMELVYKKEEYTKEEALKFVKDFSWQEFVLKGPSLIRKLEIEFKGFLKYQVSTKPLLQKRALIWRKRLSLAMPIIYAVSKYQDIEVNQTVQNRAKEFLNQLQLQIRRLNLLDKLIATILHHLMLRYQKKLYQEDFVISQKLKRRVYNNI